MAIDLTVVQDQIWEVLKEHLEAFKEDLKDDYAKTALEISKEAASYVGEVLKGSAEAEQNMKHLKAQAALLGATMAVKEQKRVVETVEKVAVVAAQVLARVLLAI